MRYFMVSYAHEKGFGRILFSVDGRVDESVIKRWEAYCSAISKTATSLIAISPIDGPIENAETV